MREIKKRGYIDMKDFAKKLMSGICVASIILTVACTSVFATEGFRSGPGEQSSVTDTVEDKESENESTDVSTKSSEPQSVTSAANTQNVSPKKYLTKWGGFFWFLLSVIVNFILSCWIGSRFYRLARRSAQSSSEIRALRKDIEERFASTLKDIDEPVTEVINRNESYARTDEGMSMPDRRPTVEINDEEREILGRWDMKRTAVREDVRETENGNEDTVRESRSYSPRRTMSGIEFDGDDEDETKETPRRENSQIKNKVESIAKAGNKAKDFLSNIFPFDD